MNTLEYKEKVGACAACGNSPVSHWETHISQMISVWSSVLEYRARHTRLYRLALLSAHYCLSGFQHALIRCSSAVGLVQFHNDPTKANSYRSQVVWEEAARRGISMQQVVLAGQRTEIYHARIHEQNHFFFSLPVPLHLRAIPSAWIDDKFLLKDFLRSQKIPVPRAYSVRTELEAVQAFNALGSTVIAKPRIGSRGRHTTTHITNATDMLRAFHRARVLCPYVCVEEHLSGAVCRGTVVGGELAGFFQAFPPKITGDGRSTIDELVAGANAKRPERVEAIVLREEHEQYLDRQGLQRTSILPVGQEISLTHRTGRLFGGHTRELLSSVHPLLREYLERAARALETPLVGFDLIIENPEADPHDQTWGIIEANSIPFVDLHYLPLYGTPSPVAANVWDLWDR